MQDKQYEEVVLAPAWIMHVIQGGALTSSLIGHIAKK
jgi:hypothetical protein